MKTLSIDIETYSSVSLQKAGVYRYVEAPDFEILLFGYSADGAPVQVIDLACGEKIPSEILDALTDDAVTKWAFNANFERICLSQHMKALSLSLDPFQDNHPLSEECARYLKPEGWRCTMIWSATMGLPLSLEGVGAVLGLEKQKLTEGKDLIKYFCQPCAPTKTNGQRTRNRPFHAPEKWTAFKRYNIRDVETEMSIQQRLKKFPVPDAVWDEYHIDQEINDRGVAIDLPLVRQAIDMDARSRSELTEAMRQLTELENPNSVQQMKQWLADNGMETDSLGKKVVAELIKTAPPELKRVLMLRQQLAKSSVRKYQTMITAACADGRARGMFQFYGANRTGRWAGRLIQLQNLPQNHLPDLAEARALVRSGDYDSVEMLYEDVPDTLLQLIRTSFIPRNGQKFIVSDFSAIEARVIAWMADEQWRQEVFAKGGDIYSSFKSHQSKRFKALMRVRPRIKRIVGLTGTPSANGLMDLWAEFKILDMGERLGRFIGMYRNNYFTPDKRNGQIIYSYKLLPGTDKAIYKRISDITISMKAADHLKMPELVMNNCVVDLSDDERERYGSKVWHSNSKYRKVIWRCNHKYDGDKTCHTPHLTDDEIQAAFLKAVNKLLETKDEVIANGYAMIPVLFDTTALKAEHDELLQETQVVSDMVQQCIYENAHVALDQAEYQKRYDALTQRFDKAKARLEEVTEEISQKQTQRANYEAFLKAFERLPDQLPEFTLKTWHGLVDYVTVYAEDDIRFTFKNGQEVKA